MCSVVISSCSFVLYLILALQITTAAVAVYTHYEWKKLEEKEKRLARHPYFMEARMRYRTKLQDEMTTEHIVQAESRKQEVTLFAQRKAELEAIEGILREMTQY